MDEKYRSLFDVLSRQGGSLRAEVETKEEIHPLQIPNVKLEGAESYASSQSMLRPFWSQGNWKATFLAQQKNWKRKTQKRSRNGR